MRRLRLVFQRPAVLCLLWIAVCFSLTSGVWLSWEYHLLTWLEPGVSDIYTMVVGYLLQAAGTGLSALLLRRQETRSPALFWGALGVYLAVSLPALLSGSAPIALAFGLLMNGACGVIAGFYLYAAATAVEEGQRGLVFGGGYGLSTVLVFLLSLIGAGSFMKTPAVLLVYLPLAVTAALLARPLLGGAPLGAAPPAAPAREFPARTWALALVTVCLLSLVKNMGFSFPSADMAAGVSVELSRLFYAVGLAAAGFITDRSRKHGAACTLVALAIPFVTLAIAGEQVPSMISWALDYLFFGFFSVFRAVLIMDMAVQSGRRYLAPLGLLAGRAGDAAGAGLCMLLSGSRLALVLLTLALFIPTSFLFFRLYRALYQPEAVREKSEREVFEGFSIQHDLSTREKEVLRLVLAEQSNTQIAEALFVSESTIKYHVHNLLQKTGCKSRQELVKKYNLTLYPQLTEK